MKFEHKLMFNNFRKEDFKPVISLLTDAIDRAFDSLKGIKN